MTRTYLPLTLLLLLSLHLASVAAAAHCSCNAVISDAPDPAELHNAAQKVSSVMWTLIPGAMAVPHQLALVTAAMYEAHAVAKSLPQLTTFSGGVRGLSPDHAVAYAGYAALVNALPPGPNKHRLHEAMNALGFGDASLRETVGAPIAAAVAAAFPLNVPPPMYMPPNPPSDTANAQCETIHDPDGWQPLCLLTPESSQCTPQAIPFAPFFNASLVSFGGARRVNLLTSAVPAPPTFTHPLSQFGDQSNNFTEENIRTLKASARLNDENKILAEVFAPSAARGALLLALNEVVARRSDLSLSVRVMFAVSAAARDAVVGAVTVKLTYSTMRPITVLQCGLRDERVRAWRGRYKGVGKFINSANKPWSSYIQTPPFPGYISGHSAVASSAGRVLRKFFGKKPHGANCFIVSEGGSTVEPKISRGEPGYIEGVTDRRNNGSRSVGYSPARETRVCWESFYKYAKLVAKSRLVGGIHTPVENLEGLKLGQKVGNKIFEVLQ